VVAQGESDARTDPGITRLTGPLLGLVRIAIGYLWFTQTLWKLPPSFGCNASAAQQTGLCDWIGREIQHPQFGFYASFLRNIVEPNLSVFGWLIFFGELATAILLIFGVLTRLGGLLGFVQGVNLWVGLAAVPHEWSWTYIMLALINLTLALTAAGRWVGCDAFLHPRAAAAGERGSRLGRLVAALT
jgi:thiosulfate dehydrogenase (quinone) large subunit